MVVVAVSNVENNMQSNKEDSTVLLRDTLNRKDKQVAQLVTSSCVLTVCKPTRFISPPIVLDCVLHMQACPEKDIINMRVDRW